jgi:hypothetical protein
MTKPSASWYSAQIKDEAKAVKTYRKHGYPDLARQEARHKRFLKKEKQKRH